MRDKAGFSVMCTVEAIAILDGGKVGFAFKPISKYCLKIDGNDYYVATKGKELRQVDIGKLKGTFGHDVAMALSAVYGSGREVELTLDDKGNIMGLK